MVLQNNVLFLNIGLFHVQELCLHNSKWHSSYFFLLILEINQVNAVYCFIVPDYSAASCKKIINSTCCHVHCNDFPWSNFLSSMTPFYLRDLLLPMEYEQNNTFRVWSLWGVFDSTISIFFSAMRKAIAFPWILGWRMYMEQSHEICSCSTAKI